MARPSLPLGTYGKIETWQEGPTWLARTKFRDYDGIVRPVKRSGKAKAAAVRKLKEALAERQMPVTQAEITPHTKIGKWRSCGWPRSNAPLRWALRAPGL